MAMDLRDIEVFLAVVDEGSFGRAATSLFMSQPSVSERMREMERRVGGRLFERGTRGVDLTAAGRRLLPFAQRMRDLARAASDAVAEETGAPPLRIACHTTFAHRAVPFVLDALDADRYRISVRDAHTNEVQASVLDGAADIGFVLPGPTPRGLREVQLPRDPVVCVAAPDHALARKRRLSIADLGRAKVALNAWGEGTEAFLSQLSPAIDPCALRTLSDANTAALLARAHGHIAVITRSAVEQDLSRRELVQLPVAGVKWTVPLALTYRARDRDDPVVMALSRAARALSALARRPAESPPGAGSRP